MIKGLPTKLRDLRIQYNYSQKDVAEKLGISPSIVSGYENGDRTPSTEVLLSLSRLFHCTTDYLLKETESEPLLIDVSGLNNEQIFALKKLIDTMQK